MNVAQTTQGAIHDELNVFVGEVVVGQHGAQVGIAEFCHHVQILQLCAGGSLG